MTDNKLTYHPTYFGKFGSYLDIYKAENKKSEIELIKTNTNEPTGMFIRSLYGKSSSKLERNNNAIRIDMEYNDECISYDHEINYDSVVMSSEHGEIEVTYADLDTIVIRGKGEIGLYLDNCPKYYFDLIVAKKKKDKIYHLLTSYKKSSLFVINTIKGSVELQQNYSGDQYNVSGELISRLKVTGEDGEFLVSVKQLKHNMSSFELTDYDFDQCKQNHLNEFETFYQKFKKPMEKDEELYKMCVYQLWSNDLRPSGIVKRNLICTAASMLGSWSFDNAFMAYGLRDAYPQLALDQILLHFDLQDEDGCIPGSTTDLDSRWVFLKAPGQGVFFKTLLENYEIDQQQKEEILDKLGKNVNYWLKYRDADEDGLCEYNQGNESDMDNTTIYDDHISVDSPDIAAYLVVSMDLLAKLAKELGKDDLSVEWKAKADSMASKALSSYIDENHRIVARRTNDKSVIKSYALTLYMMLLIGYRMDKQVVKDIVDTFLKENVGPYGIASEAFISEKYNERGIFRGPAIYHGILVIDAINDLGMSDIAKDLAAKYCRPYLEEGRLMESCNAQTGKAFTYTESAASAGGLIYVYNKYLNL